MSQSGRIDAVFLPAMLCDDELYRPQIEELRDVLEPRVLTVAEATMADAAGGRPVADGVQSRSSRRSGRGAQTGPAGPEYGVGPFAGFDTAGGPA